MATSFKVLLVVSLTVLCCVHVEGRPHDKAIGKIKYNKCDKNSGIDVRCQKCAKITKSPIVYPMCCTNQEEVERWCNSYLNFGLQKRTVLPPIIRENLHKIKLYDLSKLDTRAPNTIG